MNKYFLYAASALALASCSSDDFLGENSGNGQNASSAINFGGNAARLLVQHRTQELHRRCSTTSSRCMV